MLVVTRQKDPKKVEAGRRGAAAREAKLRERILARLSAEKENLLDVPTRRHEVPVSSQTRCEASASRPPEPRQSSEEPQAQAQVSHSPWLIAAGGLVVAGVVMLMTRRGRQARSATESTAPTATPLRDADTKCQSKPAGPNPHLNGRDLFDM